MIVIREWLQIFFRLEIIFVSIELSYQLFMIIETILLVLQHVNTFDSDVLQVCFYESYLRCF